MVAKNVDSSVLKDCGHFRVAPEGALAAMMVVWTSSLPVRELPAPASIRIGRDKK